MVKGGVLPAVAMSAALAFAPDSASAESRFETGDKTAVEAAAHLDFTIVVPEFIVVETGARTKPDAPARAMRRLSIRTVRAADDTAGPATRIVSNGGTMGSLAGQSADFTVALP
jgi:hypothetical protein